MHFLFLRCCEIVQKILQNSTTPEMNTKACPVLEEGRVDSDRPSRLISGQKV